MIIEPNKPLPGHTKRNYDECYAKLVLEKFFPERYGQLLHEDKPDLQGPGVGIEITTANAPEIQEGLSNWVNANNCPCEEKKRYSIGRMEQLGIKYSGGIQAWPGFVPTFDLSRRAVETKIKKLQKGLYKLFPRYELFIFTDTWYHDGIVCEAKTFLFDKAISDYYKTVYVLSQGSYLHVFDTVEKRYEFKALGNIKYDLSDRARQMVEDSENGDISVKN